MAPDMTLFPANLATTREEFFRQQARSVTWRCSGFSLNNWIMGLVEVFFICVNVFRIPQNREIIAVGGAIGLLFNALVISIHLLLCSNERKLKKNPHLELKCFHTQEVLLTYLLTIEMGCFLMAAHIWVYFVALQIGTSVVGFFVGSSPQDPNRYAKISGHQLLQAFTGSLFFFWFFSKPSSSRAVSRLSQIMGL